MSDWIARPITCKYVEKTESELSKPFYLCVEKLQHKLNSLDSSVFQHALGQYHSLAATSTSLSQVSDDSQECLSEIGDMQTCFDLCNKRFKADYDG